jgi:hypothetical protein
MSQQQPDSNVAITSPTCLLDLPTELLLLIPNYLHDIEDHKNLSSTCRKFRDCCATTSPLVILRLCVAAIRIFFRPNPEFLVSALAAHIGEWAARSDENARIFEDYCYGGMPGMLDLALEKVNCGLTMERIREMYELRMSTINPVTDLLDKCIGTQWMAPPDFWSGGVSDPETIRACSGQTFYHLCIYGEIFRPALEQYITTGTSSLYAQPHIRLCWVRYCMTDPYSRSEPDDVLYADGTMHPLPGSNPRDSAHAPDARSFKEVSAEFDDYHYGESLLGMRHLLSCSKWSKAIRILSDEVRAVCGSNIVAIDRWDRDENATSAKEALWASCFFLSGYQGLEQLARCCLAEYGQKKRSLDEGWVMRRMKPMWGVLGHEGLNTNMYRVVELDGAAMWPDLENDADRMLGGR